MLGQTGDSNLSNFDFVQRNQVPRKKSPDPNHSASERNLEAGAKSVPSHRNGRQELDGREIS